MSRASLSRGPPQPSIFSGDRNMAKMPAHHRPGSSMSISSMLGSDAGLNAGEPAPAATINESPPTRTNLVSSPAMQRDPALSPAQRAELAGALHPRPQSPERSKASQVPFSRPSRALSGTGSERPFPIVKMDSPLMSRTGSSTGLFVAPFSPVSESGARMQWKTSQDSHTSTDRPVPRPNSQPSDARSQMTERETRLRTRPGTSEADGHYRFQNAQKLSENSLLAKASTDDERLTPGTRPGSGYLDIRAVQVDRRPTVQTLPQSGANPALADSPASPGTNRTPLTSQPHHPENRPDGDSLANRMLDREQSVPMHSPFSSESLRRLREERLGAGPHQPNSTLSPASPPSRFTERGDHPAGQPFRREPLPTGPNAGGPSETDGRDRSIRAGEDQLQIHRNSLALLLDHNRRGRVSPLPQAVQGAQGRLSGPASDPGIKSEFARMFIGIGSGVGRTGRQGSGTASPFPPSPTTNIENERRTPSAARGEQAEQIRPQAAARGGRKGRKAKEDEPSTAEPEAVDGRSVAGTMSGPGVSRTRHNHHHHPHPLGQP